MRDRGHSRALGSPTEEDTVETIEALEAQSEDQ
jgi:hypothetical protein